MEFGASPQAELALEILESMPYLAGGVRARCDRQKWPTGRSRGRGGGKDLHEEQEAVIY